MYSGFVKQVVLGFAFVSKYENVKVADLVGDVHVLAHHGIKGQKWGVRNGPPYPLDKAGNSEAQKSVAKNSRRGIIKSIDVDDFDLITYNKHLDPKVRNVVIDTIKQCEKQDGFVISEVSDKIKATSSHGIPVLQLEPLANGLLKLNVNTDYLSGKTLEEINRAFENSKNTVVNSLEEAVLHESGHAVSIAGKTAKEIEHLYDELSQIHNEGISKIAYDDGAECLAELEVLRGRGTSISDDNAAFYKKYMGREY